MRLDTIKPQDIVLANRKGRTFYAIVTGMRQRELDVEPIDKRITYHHINAREIIDVWTRRRRRNTD